MFLCAQRKVVFPYSRQQFYRCYDFKTEIGAYIVIFLEANLFQVPITLLQPFRHYLSMDLPNRNLTLFHCQTGPCSTKIWFNLKDVNVTRIKIGTTFISINVPIEPNLQKFLTPKITTCTSINWIGSKFLFVYLSNFPIYSSDSSKWTFYVGIASWWYVVGSVMTPW